jgi:hypothetical protein
MLARHDALRVWAARVGQVDEQGQRATVGKRSHDGMRERQLSRGHPVVVGISEPHLKICSDLGSRRAQPGRRVDITPQLGLIWPWRTRLPHGGPTDARPEPLVRLAEAGWLKLTALGRRRVDEDEV